MFERKKNKLAIVGYAPNRIETPFQDESFDIAGMNDLHLIENWPMAMRSDIRWDVWFDMHHPHVMQQFSRAKDAHWKWLQKTDIPVFTLEKIEEIPSSAKFPLDELVALYGMKYFTSTVAYQLAWAAMVGYEVVHVYGVNFIGREEYEYQRACSEYWIGFLRGMGIEVYVPKTSCLLQSAFLYGYETHVMNKNVSDNLLSQIQQKQVEIQSAQNEAEKAALKHAGQRDALAWIADLTGHVARGGYLPPPERVQPQTAYQQQREERSVHAIKSFKELMGRALMGDKEAAVKLEAAGAIMLGLPDDYERLYNLLNE